MITGPSAKGYREIEERKKREETTPDGWSEIVEGWLFKSSNHDSYKIWNKI